MQVEIKIPSPGESISEVEIARWLVDDNTWVEKDQELAEVESEKATLPLLASASGMLHIKVQSGSIRVGEVACIIDTEAKKTSAISREESKSISKKIEENVQPQKVEEKKREPLISGVENPHAKATPLARKLMDENDLRIDDVVNGLKKVTSKEVKAFLNSKKLMNQESVTVERTEERTTMSQLRKKLSQRLVSVKNETAMLTTFNEVDMSRIIEIRKNYQKEFQEKYGVKLGFMSFFTRAVVEALKQHPMVNSRIDGDEIVTPNFFDIGIAVQTPKGLMVPVLRNAETLSFAQIEHRIFALAEKGRNGRIGLDDLKGGTFTITNGGIFGSMLSTPILNPPQSGILGMHNIFERPIAVNGKVEIRPMMYIALSYDHRIIDGKDSVGFLVKVKQMLEKHEVLTSNGIDPNKLLLNL